MKNLLRYKVVLAVLSFLLIVAAICTLNMPVKTNAAEKAGFSIVDGASVKFIYDDDDAYSEKSGMRFSLKISASVYAELVENGQYKDDVEVGMLLVPESLKNGELTYGASKTNANIYKAAITVEKWKANSVEAPTEYTTFVSVYDFSSDYYNEVICARGYMVSGANCYETAIVERSMAEVALAAKENVDSYATNETNKEEILRFLDAYVSVPYTVTFKNGDEAVDVQTKTYGTKLENLSIEAESGYEFAGWLYNGKAWDFEKDVVKGNMELTASFKQSYITLTQDDVENFQSIIESNMSGTFYLGEDLDFTGVTFKSIGGLENNSDTIDVFTGVLDGKGYAIKNLTISARDIKDQYNVYREGASNLIADNNGTIKNLYIQATMANVNNYVGVVGINDGVVENLYVDITLTGNMTGNLAQKNGSIVCRNNNNATVKNCIVNLHASDLTGNQVFGTVVGCNHSGAQYPIANNYAITNEFVPSYSTSFPGKDVLQSTTYNEEIRLPKNCANYDDAVSFFTSVKELSDANGWGDYWTLVDNTLKFGDETVLDLSGITLLTQDDVENFQSIIENNISGTFYLGEDLDFTGVTFKSIGGAENSSDALVSFTGVLDGRGHAIKNLTITKRNGIDGYNVYRPGSSNLIAKNRGTIKNLYVQATMADVNCYAGIVGRNEGVVENMYVDITLTGNMTGTLAQMNGGVVARNQADATVKNCIANINLGSLSGSQNFGTVVGGNYSNVPNSIMNNYGITNGLVTNYTKGATDVLFTHSNAELATMNIAKNNANYDNAKALVESVTLSSADGWSKYWSLSNGTLKFGDEVIYSA